MIKMLKLETDRNSAETGDIFSFGYGRNREARFRSTFAYGRNYDKVSA